MLIKQHVIPLKACNNVLCLYSVEKIKGESNLYSRITWDLPLKLSNNFNFIKKYNVHCNPG